MADRSISTIANDIRKDWGAKIYFGAKPYLEAMADPSFKEMDDFLNEVLDDVETTRQHYERWFDTLRDKEDNE